MVVAVAVAQRVIKLAAAWTTVGGRHNRDCIGDHERAHVGEPNATQRACGGSCGVFGCLLVGERQSMDPDTAKGEGGAGWGHVKGDRGDVAKRAWSARPGPSSANNDVQLQGLACSVRGGVRWLCVFTAGDWRLTLPVAVLWTGSCLEMTVWPRPS